MRTLSIGLGLLVVLGLTPPVWADTPSTLLTDTDGISGFELYGQGLHWWRGDGGCGGEFPVTATLRLRGTPTGATKKLARDCTLLDGVSNVVRDDAYVYFIGNGQLQRKALNAAETDPSTEVSTPPYSPTLPSWQNGAVLELANGQLYFARLLSSGGNSALYSLKTDGSGSAAWLANLGQGGVSQMEWVNYSDSGTSTEALVILMSDGRLLRYKLGGGVTQLASGIASFALHSVWSFFSSSTSVYAAQGAQTGKLFKINLATGSGATTAIYTASGINQLTGVTTDSALSLISLGNPVEKYVYISEAPVSCGSLLCVPGVPFIKRHALSTSTFNNWQLIVSSGNGGGNLRSDDQWLYFTRGNSIMKISTGAAPLQLDLKADAMEVVQASQTLNNSVPLVANRPTFVRAYAHVETNTTGNSTFLPEATLRGFRNGVELSGSPLIPTNDPKIDSTKDMNTLRPALDRGFLFQLPDSWTSAGSISLQFTVNPHATLPETGAASNTVGPAVFTFNSKASPCLVFVPVWTRPATISSNPPGLSQMVARARSLLPVERFKTFHKTSPLVKPVVHVEVIWTPLPIPVPVIHDEPYDFPGDQDTAMAWLTIRDLTSSDPSGCLDPSHWVGMVHPDEPDFNGLGLTSFNKDVLVRMDPGGNVSSLKSWGLPMGGRTLAHELSHNYGREHIDQSTTSMPTACGGKAPKGPFDVPPFDTCTIGSPTDPTALFGLDSLKPTVIPPGAVGDLMSYATTRWVSDFTWKALFNELPATSSFAPLLAPGMTPLLSGPVLLVTGLVDDTRQTATFESFLQFPQGVADAGKLAKSASASAAASRDAQPFYLRLLDASGAVLSDTPLATDAGTEEGSKRVFVQYVPFASETARVQLVRGSLVYVERAVSANAPVLSLGTPVADTAARTLTVSWSASDADTDDALLYTLQYSSDDGQTWQTVLTAHPWSTAVLDTRMLAGTPTARVRVLVSDGVNTRMATSNAFTLPRNAPEARIDGILEGERLPYGQQLSLQGLAVDAEDGALTGGPLRQLRWSLSGPVGASGSGESLLVGDLPPGSYTATLSATDSDKQVGSAVRHFEVLPLAIPEGVAPRLDGECNDSAYTSGASIRLSLGNGRYARGWLLHSGTTLSACFADLKLASGSSTATAVGLRMDANASRDTVAQPGDLGFYVDQEGIPFQVVGNGSAMPVTLSPRAGYTAVIQRNANGWSAELSIADSLVGGWNHAAGVMVSHTGLTSVGDDWVWPTRAVSDKPSTWASAWLGTLPAQPNRAPTAEAGEPQRIVIGAERAISLDGGASFDPDGDALAYSWTQVSGPAVTLTEAGTATPNFTMDRITAPVTLQFQLSVSDGSLRSVADTVQVQLIPGR
ncbi:fibronectin type III domain-containing protein [Cystobacter fuscus]|uniref:fibronectin type III domain-containing protein n=1 Tax=Cystobacter fuscus TaxID=43 RepID=UPI002B2DEEA0|nr:fibronectin type III domain-containing protein [Cystobacter fuscus]